MRLSEISPPPPCLSGGKKRFQRKGAQSGGYNWELGDLAFGNPLDRIGNKAKLRLKSRVRWKEKGSKKRTDKSERSDYHRKHG